MNATTIKVLICDDTAEKGIKIASRLRELNIYAFTRRNEGNVILNSILSDMPDVVVAELSLKDTDSVSIMERVRSVMSNSPQFIIISDIQNSFIERQVLESGAAYIMTAPVDPDELFNIIKLVAIKKSDSDCTDVELIVTELIRGLGIPAHIKGYRYIRTAILESIQSRILLESVTKSLYPKVADIHNTTPARVERAIRHAIEAAWNRHNNEAMSSFFGYKIEEFRSRPTNSEFIALAADKIGLQLKSNGAYDRSSYSNPLYNCY